MVLARGVGLLAVDLLPGLKNTLVQRATGMLGKLPDLACGIVPSGAT